MRGARTNRIAGEKTSGVYEYMTASENVEMGQWKKRRGRGEDGHMSVAARLMIMLLMTTPAWDETSTNTKVARAVATVEMVIVPRRPQDVSMRYAPSRLPGIPLTVRLLTGSALLAGEIGRAHV